MITRSFVVVDLISTKEVTGLWRGVGNMGGGVDRERVY